MGSLHRQIGQQEIASKKVAMYGGIHCNPRKQARGSQKFETGLISMVSAKPYSDTLSRNPTKKLK